MKRLNENESADIFVQKVCGGYYNYERSVNTEVDYQKEKEERDTSAVKEFVGTNVFSKFTEMV